MTVELISGLSRGADHPAASPGAASAKQGSAVRTPPPAATRQGGYVRCTSLPLWRRSPVPDVVRRHERRRYSGFRGGGKVLGFAAALLLGGLALTAAAQAAAPARLTFTMVRVGSPRNRAVGIIPFQDAIFRSCSVAPKTRAGCLNVGSVGYRYEIGELEVTVAQWVAFLNTVDPTGTDRHHLYDSLESSSAWPRFGQIDFFARRARAVTNGRLAGMGRQAVWLCHDFLRAARFVNSLTNGKVLSRPTVAPAASVCHFTVRLSRQTESGMYDLAGRNATRDRKRGFVVPSQNEWIKAAYYDPTRRRHVLLLEVPDQSRRLRDGGQGDAPSAATLRPHNRRRHQRRDAAAGELHAVHWLGAVLVPVAAVGHRLRDRQPVRARSRLLTRSLPGQPRHGRPGRTRSPWGTLDQGGNAVEWTDTITAPPPGLPAGASGGACTAASPTPPHTSSGSRRSACSRRTTRSFRNLPVARVPDRIHRMRPRGRASRPECWATGFVVLVR